MGRINKYSNGDQVNQHRKSQGKFLEKQDIEAYLSSKKLNNGNNIQGKNTLNTDDLPNISAILDYALNLSRQNGIEFLDGGKAHNLTAQAFLTALTALSAISPNIVSSKKAISTDNPNSLSSMVKNFTEMSNVLFDTTSATSLTSQNHDKSKELTKHNDDQSFIRGKRAVGDGLILHNADGNIILNGNKLTFSYDLNINMLKQQLKNSNITKLCLWTVKIDPQKAQEIREILESSNVKELSILHGSIEGIDFGTMLTDTKVTTLNLAYNGIGNKSAKGLITSLKKTNVKVLDLSDNRIGNTGKGAKGLIKLLEKTNVKALDLSNNNMSDEKVNNIIPELKKNTQIIELGLKDKGIERNTLKEVLKVLKQNRHVNKESTSTIKSSPTEGESSTTEEDHTSNKREKRDIHTTDETLPEQETTVLTTDVSSTTTTESTTPTTVSTTTTESTTPTTVSTTTTESTTPTTVSTTTTESTTPKKNLTEKSEPIAAGGVADSTIEKHTSKESNPNNPASSTMSIGEILGLISFALTTIGAGGGVVIYVIKKFFGGVSHSGHEDLALGKSTLVELENRLDKETSSLTGVIVDDNPII
ncbi:MAG: hypothetical protein DMENIID0002_13080 [Rickettsia endosymbiont of Sergentomyia squamirostris]|uniref:Uncharacterized protein n=1 Tax=Candidatus Tisiphia endosymbiont of Sergentomyia squamirostris TaxID=3113639 RepID=A0AAT9GA16_9RICK